MDVLDVIYKTTVILTFAGASLLLIMKGGRIFDGIRSLIAIAPQLKEIVKEFRPNGGSSMRDQLNRLELAHRTIDSDNKTQLVRVQEVKNELGALKEDVGALKVDVGNVKKDLKDLSSRLVSTK